MPSQDVNVSVVVPVYRNVDTLSELYRRLCQTLESLVSVFEVIFVDDACPDGSMAVLESLAQNDPRVGVLVLERNVGQQRAVLAGLAHALGEWIVIMDADLQDPPEVIPALLAKGQDGFAAVFAGRRGKYESSSRLLCSRLFKGLLHLLTGVPADAGIFVAFNRLMLGRILAMGGRNPHVVAMIGCARLPLTSIPVIRAQRPSGNSAYTFKGRLKSGWRAIGWVLSWKLRRCLIKINPPSRLSITTRQLPSTPVRVARHIGSRFTSPTRSTLHNE